MLALHCSVQHLTVLEAMQLAARLKVARARQREELVPALLHTLGLAQSVLLLGTTQSSYTCISRPQLRGDPDGRAVGRGEEAVGAGAGAAEQPGRALLRRGDERAGQRGLQLHRGAAGPAGQAGPHRGLHHPPALRQVATPHPAGYYGVAGCSSSSTACWCWLGGGVCTAGGGPGSSPGWQRPACAAPPTTTPPVRTALLLLPPTALCSAADFLLEVATGQHGPLAWLPQSPPCPAPAPATDLGLESGTWEDGSMQVQQTKLFLFSSGLLFCTGGLCNHTRPISQVWRQRAVTTGCRHQPDLCSRSC